MKVSDNKNSFFKIKYELSDKSTISERVYSKNLEMIENNLHEIFDKLDASNIHYVKRKDEDQVLYYLFKTNKRKRVGQVRNMLDNKVLSKYEISTETEPLTKVKFNNIVAKFDNNNNIEVRKEPEEKYKGKELKIFEDRSKWWEWQEEFYKYMFDKNDNMREAPTREIILLKDTPGNCGKSTFLKWLYLKNIEDIGYISDGDVNQIRTSAVNQDQKKAYFVDLARTSCSERNVRSLMCALEDIKNGIVNKLMYGSGKVLVFDQIPWIVIASNTLPLGGFSADRWIVYDMQKIGADVYGKNPDRVIMKDISKEVQEIARDKILIDQEEERMKIKVIREKAKKIRLGKCLES